MSGVPSLPIRRRDDDLDTELGAIDTAGAVIIEDFLSDRQLADLRAELAPHAAEADPDMEHVNDVM